MKDKNTQSNKREETRVTIHFPEEVSIELVQANGLRQYELFNWLAAITASIAAGFWTAFVPSDKSMPLLISAIAFSIMTALFIFLVFRQRKKIYHKSIKKSVLIGDFKNDLKTEINHQ